MAWRKSNNHSIHLLPLKLFAMNPSEIVREFFKGNNYANFNKKYHAPLPADLAPWYIYVVDSGHSILALIEGNFDKHSADLVNELCPCPVKTALRQYEMFQGYPVVKAEYSAELGLIAPDGDEEF
jgi:hypothetical protein